MATLGEAKKLWVYWDVRVLILLSLLIQVVLTFLAPLRKSCSSGILKFILWMLYLSASAVALYVISQITGNSGGVPDVDLLAFWAPFLLLHLGGPDSITALALEDNELWLRHVLELVTQLGVTLYVFISAVRKSNSWMWIPTALMFIDGFIKYLERAQALYKASIDSFRDSLESEAEPGPNYARLMDVYYSSTTANIPTIIQGKDDPNSDNNSTNKEAIPKNKVAPSPENPDDNNAFPRVDTSTLIIAAHDYYIRYKGLLADNFLSLKDRKESRDFFVRMTGAEAVRIIEIELNLIYDVFYTKVFLVNSRQAYLRVFSYVSVIASLVFFSFLDKKNYKSVDVVITYILLVGALALDVCAIVMLVLSDWYIVMNEKRIKNQVWQANISTTLLKWFKFLRRPNDNRWSRSISRYNLLQRCFKDPPFIYELGRIKRIKDSVIGFFYVNKDPKKEEAVVKFIVTELLQKAILADDENLPAIKGVCSARGDLFLDEDYCLISDYLKPWTTDIDYDESVLTWHIATDICFHTCTTKSNAKDISANLSDYMAYLLLRNQTLVSTVVGMSDTRSADTRAEAKKFYTNKRLSKWSTDIWMWFVNKWYSWACQKEKIGVSTKDKESEFFREFCESLLKVNVDIQPIVAKGDKSKSVLFEACRLAKQLKMLGTERQWEITSKVWLELMCYAAVRCSPRSHIAQLNSGGELITLVWLLMAHLGFGERFLQNQGYGWTKLIIQK